jgi:hypothetical protein
VASFLDATIKGLTKRLRKDYKMVRIGLERRFLGGIVNEGYEEKSPQPPFTKGGLLLRRSQVSLSSKKV